MPEASHPLRVLHVGPTPDSGRNSNGVDVAVWPMLKAQRVAGATVSVLMQGDPSPADTAEAANADIELLVVRRARYRPRSWALGRNSSPILDRGRRPDIVHFHSVFIPEHAQLARKLRLHGIPYVVTPHGGLKLWNGKLKKCVYGALLEKPYFRHARALFPLTKREEDVILSWIGSKSRIPQFIEIPNSIPPAPFGSLQWALPTRQRLVYLGRFNVMQKGIDRLVDIARNMPGVEICAYGDAVKPEMPGFEKLCRSGLPENIRFHSPVYGDEKSAALTSASMYLQLSRDEGFGMSIVEAMRLGVPVGLTRGCAISDQIGAKDLGLIIPDDPAKAAAVLSAALRDENKLYQWSSAGQKWTIEALSPECIAERTLAAYRMYVSSA
jgi:glycosyltransferase involved in cell wall biosynthesis